MYKVVHSSLNRKEYMKDRAYAKINLSLDVFNIREDGYHDISSIMIPVNFYDELEIVVADKDSFECNKSYIQNNEYNSIVKMLSVLRQRYDLDDCYRIKLNKYIPTKAGLGGGTADAASALRIIKRMYRLDMSKQEINDICLKVGADVPFNYYNVAAKVSGIGDIIEPFVMKKTYYVLLVKPKLGVSTKKAYELLDMDKCDHPDIDIIRQILIDGDDFSGLLGNSLEQPAMILNKDIEAIKTDLINSGARNVLMSGSGSTVFCIDEDKMLIKKLYEKYKNSKHYVRFTQTLNR